MTSPEFDPLIENSNCKHYGPSLGIYQWGDSDLEPDQHQALLYNYDNEWLVEIIALRKGLIASAQSLS